MQDPVSDAAEDQTFKIGSTAGTHNDHIAIFDLGHLADGIARRALQDPILEGNLGCREQLAVRFKQFVRIAQYAGYRILKIGLSKQSRKWTVTVNQEDMGAGQAGQPDGIFGRTGCLIGTIYGDHYFFQLHDDLPYLDLIFT
jgi:hypothetical protein